MLYTEVIILVVYRAVFFGREEEDLEGTKFLLNINWKKKKRSFLLFLLIFNLNSRKLELNDLHWSKVMHRKDTTVFVCIQKEKPKLRPNDFVWLLACLMRMIKGLYLVILRINSLNGNKSFYISKKINYKDINYKDGN